MSLRYLEIDIDPGNLYVTAAHVFFDLPTGRIGDVNLRTSHLRHLIELVDRVMTRLYPQGNWNLEAITCDVTNGQLHSVKSVCSAGQYGPSVSALSSQGWIDTEINELQTICDLAIKGINST